MERIDQAWKALAEPRRREILQLVAHDELAAGLTAAAFEVTRTAVSQHLTVLKRAGLLDKRRQGTRQLYQAWPDDLDARCGATSTTCGHRRWTSRGTCRGR